MAKTPANIRSLARAHTDKAIQVLGGIMASDTSSDDARIRAAATLLDRGWGKAPQAITGADGEGPVVLDIDVKALARRAAFILASGSATESDT